MGVPALIIDPLWCQFITLIPPVIDTHPLRCHRPLIPDQIIFDKLIHVLVLGASYVRIADSTCSATTLRTRRDEWITAGIFEKLEQICLESYDRIIGLDLTNLSMDGCIIKAPCYGEAAEKSPVVRGITPGRQCTKLLNIFHEGKMRFRGTEHLLAHT